MVVGAGRGHAGSSGVDGLMELGQPSDGVRRDGEDGDHSCERWRARPAGVGGGEVEPERRRVEQGIE